MAEAAAAPIRERRRAEILAAAGRLFAERGVRETTVRQIGEEVGVLAGSLYYYFRNKQGILHALMRPYVEDLVARYRRGAAERGDARERLRRLLHTQLQALIDHPNTRLPAAGSGRGDCPARDSSPTAARTSTRSRASTSA